MNIKPLADRVLVVPAPAEEKIGGIIIPDTAKEKPLRGIVKAVGKGTKDEEMILKACSVRTIEQALCPVYRAFPLRTAEVSVSPQ